MNSKVCSHNAKVNTGSRVNCALCNVFISAVDGKPAIKDPTLGGLHQTYPATIYNNLLSDSTVLTLKRPIPPLYVSFRLMLIDWIKTLKNRFRLSDSTFHIAIKYMDYILSQKEYHNSKYQLIGLSCLILAAKYDELDMNIPFPEDFARIARLPYRNYVIPQCETLLLEMLDWNLKISTVYSIGRCLLSQGVLFDDDRLDKQHTVPNEEYARLLTKMVESLIDSSIRGINSYYK